MYPAGAFGNIADNLTDYLGGFQNFMQADISAGMQISFRSRDDVEVKFAVSGVRSFFAYIGGNAGTTGHGAYDAETERIFLGKHADAHSTFAHHGIIFEDVAELLNLRLKLVELLKDEVEAFLIQIVLGSADAVEGEVHAVAVDGFLDVLHEFPDFHGVHEEGGVSAKMSLDGDVEEV